MNQQKRVQAGVPTGGQFAASERAESGVSLLTDERPVALDLRTQFRGEIDDLDRRWRDEADTEGVFNGLIGSLAQRVLDATEPDRPGREKLADALAVFQEDRFKDDDQAEEVLFCLQDITARDTMKVAQQADGSYLRLADGKPGHACPGCNNGYATKRALKAHMDGDCVSIAEAPASAISVGDRVWLRTGDGLSDEVGDIVTVTSTDGDHKSISIEFDNDPDTIASYDRDEPFPVIGQTADEFLADMDAMHDAADDFVSALSGEEKVAFLKRHKVPAEQIDAARDAEADDEFALDDIARDLAHKIASGQVNGGGDADSLRAVLRGEG